MLNINKYWGKMMLSFIAQYKLEKVILVDSPDKSACLTLAKQKQMQTETEKWQIKLMSDGNDQNGNIERIKRNSKPKIMSK